MYKLVLGIAAGLLLFSSPTMAACTVPNTLTNGTTADATLVMGNFTSLAACAAPLASPSFTGNVGINTSAATTLDVQTASGVAVVRVKANTSSANITLDRYLNSDSYSSQLSFNTAGTSDFALGTSQGWAASDSFAIYDYGNSSVPFTIVKSTGYIGIATTTPGYQLTVSGTAYATGAAGALSDIRHKKNIVLLGDDALQKVLHLRPVSFDWRDPKDAGMQGRQMGFIAQDVEKILPSVVLTEANAEKTKGLKYNELIALLTKAIQEQQAEITTLRTGQVRQVRALEAANDNQLREMATLRAKFDSLERSVRVRSAAR